MLDDYEQLGQAIRESKGKIDLTTRRFNQTVYTIEWAWGRIPHPEIKEHRLGELAAKWGDLYEIAHDDDAPTVYFTRARAEAEVAEIMEAHE